MPLTTLKPRVKTLGSTVSGPAAQARIRGRTLQAARKRIDALADGGRDVDGNTEPQCRACNLAQEARDRARR